MAKFWTHMKYHEDVTEKHKITPDEIQFLKSLQKEMNTQDTLSQADPRYWVIRDLKKIYGEHMNNPDGYTFYCIDDCQDVFEFKSTTLEDDEIAYVASYFTDNYNNDFKKEDFANVTDLDSLKELLDEKGYGDDFAVLEYEIYPDYSGFFLTHKMAETHLRNNAHHYNKDATTYAMTAWRNPETDKLYQILQSVDFDSLL